MSDERLKFPDGRIRRASLGSNSTGNRPGVSQKSSSYKNTEEPEDIYHERPASSIRKYTPGDYTAQKQTFTRKTGEKIREVKYKLEILLVVRTVLFSRGKWLFFRIAFFAVGLIYSGSLLMGLLARALGPYLAPLCFLSFMVLACLSGLIYNVGVFINAKEKVKERNKYR